MLSINDALSVKDLHAETVEVPEWGGEVRIRVLRADELSELQQMEVSKLPPVETRRQLLVKVMVNEDGSPWATESQMAELMSKSSIVIDRLFVKAMEISGLISDDAKKN